MSIEGTEQLPGVRISGIGSEIPPEVVTTAEVEERAELHERFGFEPGWLERVTGVHERRWAGPEVQPSELATLAAKKALADAGIDPLEIDTLIFTGITRDCLEPATANLVAERVGSRNARVFDLINACNSLIDGVDVADSLIRSGKARRVLLATGERASLAINWQARTVEEALRSVASLVVGDGGGALIVEPAAEAGRGLRGRVFRSDATQWRHAVGGQFRVSTQPCEICGSLLDRRFMCDGRGLFAAAFGLLYPAMEEVMEQTGWRYDELDLVFCHQPTKRFVDNAIPLLAEPARIAAQRLWITADRFGNMSTASLPLAMTEARDAGALVPGAKLLVLAPSSGVSAAAVTMVW